MNSFKIKYIEKPSIGVYFVIISLVFILMQLFTFPEALDITRYYENAIIDAREYNNVFLYIKNLLQNDMDFIYMASFYIAQKCGVPLNIVTTVYISIYYISICEIIRICCGLKCVPPIVLVFILLGVPFLWVQCISRTTAAVAFLYCSVLNLYKGNNKKMIFYALASIFTHVSMVVFVLLLISVYIFKDYIVLKRKFNSLLPIFLVLVFFCSSYLFVAFSYIAGSMDNRYATYADFSHESTFLASSIGYGDKIPTIIFYLYSIYIVLKVKTHDFFYYSLLVLVLLLTMTINTSFFFTNRIMMVMPLFLGVNVSSLLYNNSYERKTIVILSFVGFIGVLLHFYSYRMEYVF